MKTVEQDF